MCLMLQLASKRYHSNTDTQLEIVNTNNHKNIVTECLFMKPVNRLTFGKTHSSGEALRTCW